MNFNELKELARKLGGIVVMNGNVPEFVILSYPNYLKFDEAKKNKDINSEEDTIEKLNREISALKDEIRQKEEAELIESAGEREVEEKPENRIEEPML